MSEPGQPWWAEGARLLERVGTRPGATHRLFASGQSMETNPAISTARTIPGVLDDAECVEVLSLARAQAHVDGGRLDRHGRRKCTCAWIPDGGVTRWLYRRVAEVFEEANATFRFRVTGLVEPVMAVSYDAGGHFDWHLDTGPELSANRKLSLSIGLSRIGDFEGGRLEFAGEVEPSPPLATGAACVFPSFLAHRVTPVTHGRRIVLVAFAHGPTFT